MQKRYDPPLHKSREWRLSARRDLNWSPPPRLRLPGRRSASQAHSMLGCQCGYNISRTLQRKQTRGAICALQIVRSGLIDRHCAAPLLLRGHTPSALTVVKPNLRSVVDMRLLLLNMLSAFQKSCFQMGRCRINPRRSICREKIIPRCDHPLKKYL